MPLTIKVLLLATMFGTVYEKVYTTGIIVAQLTVTVKEFVSKLEPPLVIRIKTVALPRIFVFTPNYPEIMLIKVPE